MVHALRRAILGEMLGLTYRSSSNVKQDAKTGPARDAALTRTGNKTARHTVWQAYHHSWHHDRGVCWHGTCDRSVITGTINRNRPIKTNPKLPNQGFMVLQIHRRTPVRLPNTRDTSRARRCGSARPASDGYRDPGPELRTHTCVSNDIKDDKNKNFYNLLAARKADELYERKKHLYRKKLFGSRADLLVRPNNNRNITNNTIFSLNYDAASLVSQAARIVWPLRQCWDRWDLSRQCRDWCSKEITRTCCILS